MALQFGDEFFRVDRRIGFGPCIEQAVNDHDGRLLPGDFAAKQLHHLIEAFVFQRVECADKLYFGANTRGVEEAHGRQELKQPVVGFGQQRGDQNTTAVAGMMKPELIGKDGLAGTRAPLNDVRSTRDKASLKQRVESFDPALKAF